MCQSSKLLLSLKLVNVLLYSLSINFKGFESNKIK